MINRPLMYSFAGLVALWLLCPLKLGVVMGASMAPTLKNRQVIVINETYYKSHRPRVGDVVVVVHEREKLVKRITAVEGDRLWEVADPSVGSCLLVRPADLPRLQQTLRRSPHIGTLRRRVIPKGYVYVMGDAGQSSYDSRTFGPVPITEITGRVMGLPQP